MRQRTSFYRTLCKLLFLQTYTDDEFERFVGPLEQVCTQLQSIPTLEQFQQRDVRYAIMGLLRDMRGICSACINKRSYTLFFEWFYPRHFPLLVRTVEVWHDDHIVINTLLRFMAEFVTNKNSRISFGTSSPNGIILFKETSKLIATVGTQLSKRPVKNDVYAEKYKLVMLCIDVLTNGLAGNYCNFGVFDLYNDTALIDVLKVVLGVVLDIPTADIIQYPKLCRSYFALVENLFLNHMDLIIKFSTPIFLKMVVSLEDGLLLEDMALSSQICSSLDSLLVFYYKNLKRSPEKARVIEHHLQEHKNLFPRILASLFNVIIFQECGNQWSVSRTMLSLIVTHQSFFEELKKQIATSLGGERQDKMMESFSKLMEGVEMDLEPKNKDRFTGNLITFRQVCAL